MLDPANLARLRPLFSAEDLAQAMGQAWAPPRATSQGYVTALAKPYGFAARIDVTGRIGWLTFHAEQPSFHGGFSPGVAIAGLNVGMTFEAARTARPGLEQIEAAPTFDVVRYADRTEDGARLFASFRKGLLTTITVEQEGRIYPAPLAPFEGQRPKTVYDAHLGAHSTLPRRDRGTLWRQGWCHGLPPGLIAAQWPLSHQCGHPMRHAFTLRLPEEYRVKGPELVALSVFGGYFHWEYDRNPAVADFMSAPLPDQEPSDPALSALWQHRRNRHSRHYAMSDVIDTDYAAIWLTETELAGALCAPPRLDGTSLLGSSPEWLADLENMKMALPIALDARHGDPNVGTPPLDRRWDEDCADNGYIGAYSDLGSALDLRRWFGRTHLGGTLFVGQATPELSPFYLQIEEEFGGFNFAGDGTGYLDLERMTFDWQR